jgi:hypothetical protein
MRERVNSVMNSVNSYQKTTIRSTRLKASRLTGSCRPEDILGARIVNRYYDDPDMQTLLGHMLLPFLVH